jgi:hypothetical protein
MAPGGAGAPRVGAGAASVRRTEAGMAVFLIRHDEAIRVTRRHPSHQASESPGIRVTRHPSHQASESPGIRVTRHPSHQVSESPGIRVTMEPAAGQATCDCRVRLPAT